MRRYRHRLKRSRPSARTIAEQQHRAEKELVLGAKQMAFPALELGVIVEDFQRDYEVRSPTCSSPPCATAILCVRHRGALGTV